MKLQMASLAFVSTQANWGTDAWMSTQAGLASRQPLYFPPQVNRIASQLSSLNDANLEPVSQELRIRDFNVEGKIPEDLNGLYVRNGPNPKSGNKNHLFFGEGMAHGVWLHEGQAVQYSNRYVDLGKNLGESGLSNVGFVEFKSRLFSLGEFGPAFELNPADLSTIGQFNFQCKAGANICAHPKKTLDGKLHFFGYDLFSAPYLKYYCVGPDGLLIKTESIELDAPKMIHDFGVTENHVVFMDLPLVFKPAKVVTLLAKTLFGMEQTLPVQWEPSYTSRLGVMPKTGGNEQIKWFEIDPCYIFHTANAFEQADSIVFDAIRYEQFKVTDQVDLSEPAFFTRYTLNLKDGSVREQQLGYEVVEFPQIHPSKVGQPYNYLYCTLTSKLQVEKGSSHKDGLVKYDVQKSESKQIILPEQAVMGEFSFVPKENAQREDDGYLLGYVYDRHTKTSALWIFDAATFDSQPLAKVDFGVRVPNGFHGVWINGPQACGKP